MKSKLTGVVTEASNPSPSATGVCAAEYAPASTTVLHSKAIKENDFVAPFDQKKVHLTGNSINKAASSLLDQKVIVVINMECNGAADSLSSKVLSQFPQLQTELKRKALEYKITDEISADEFEQAANGDPCVIGVTYPGTLKTSSLQAPATTDTNISMQEYLTYTNYLHAYQNLVGQQSLSSPKSHVGFIDTGVDCTHPDLAANLISGCGYNAVSPGTTPTDNDGHGTNTAGLVGAVGNNNVGILGIAGNAISITAIKVIDVSSGSVQTAYDGIQYAIQNNLDVINISLQSQTSLPLIEQGVSEAVAAGIVVVVAAGNQGQELMGSVVVSPASVGRDLNGAITVGSVDSATGNLSSFSNYGDYVEIAAPGATDSSFAGSVGGNYSTYKGAAYKRMMGTSQASPVVAGATALVIQFLKAHNVSYTPANIETIVLNSSDTSSSIMVNGHRVLNFSRLTRNAYAYAGISLCK
jgi:hypothetical protein